MNTPQPAPAGNKKGAPPSDDILQRTNNQLQPLSIESIQTQLDFERKGHCVLRQILQPNFVTSALQPILWRYVHEEELMAWQQKVQVMMTSSSLKIPEEEILAAQQRCDSIEACQELLFELGWNPDEDLPFLQFFHTWRSLPVVWDAARALAPLAATLMDCSTVRLYQDSVFWKRPGDGPTRWHTDCKMAPFDTSHMITFWIPLQDVTSSGLIFCSKSHSDFALPYWNRHPSAEAWNDLESRYENEFRDDTHIVDYMPLRVGDVTAHSGWTLHCADQNDTEQDRLALAITFVDGRAPIRENIQSELHDDEDIWSYRDWVSDVPPNTRKWDHPAVPIIYHKAEK